MYSYRSFLAVCLLAYVQLSLCAHVFFEINLTWEVRAPDGQPRYVVLSNGHFPGPQLNLDYGDDVEVSHYFNHPFTELTVISSSFIITFPLTRLSISTALSTLARYWAKRNSGRHADKLIGKQIRHGQTERRAFPRNLSHKVGVTHISGPLLSMVPIGMKVN